jgi:hypothetical protein
MLDNVIVLLNLVFVCANILEILVKRKRNTMGGGAGPGSPAPVPARGATGAPAGPPGWPSTTPKWLGTFGVIGTHPLRCDGSEQAENAAQSELGGYPIRPHWSERLGFPPLFGVTILPTHTSTHILSFNGSGFGSVNLDQLTHVQHRTRRFQLLTVREAHDLDHQRAIRVTRNFDRS